MILQLTNQKDQIIEEFLIEKRKGQIIRFVASCNRRNLRED